MATFSLPDTSRSSPSLDLAGSSVILEPTNQMQSLSPGLLLPRIRPSPGAPADGPPEAVGSPTLLTDLTPSLSGPAAAPSVRIFSPPGTSQFSPLTPVGLKHSDQMPVQSPDQEPPQIGGRPITPPKSPAAPVVLTAGCSLLAAVLEPIDQVLMHPVDRPPETVGAPIPPLMRPTMRPRHLPRPHHPCRLVCCRWGPAWSPQQESYQRQWVPLLRHRLHPTLRHLPRSPHLWRLFWCLSGPARGPREVGYPRRWTPRVRPFTYILGYGPR